jgi:hypothetical protein
MKTNYIETKPLLTIRTTFPKNVWIFIKKLKSKNKCSAWVNEAIMEKYCKEIKK